MKYLLFFVPSSLLLFASCSSLHLPVEVPKCVETSIRKIREAPVTNPPAQVWQWKVDGQTNYYYFTSPCCDQFNLLYDADCHKVCAPDGGFTGKGDGTCPEFSAEPEKVLIWEDKR